MSERVTKPTQLPITPRDVVGCRHRTLLTHATAAGIVSPDAPGDYSHLVERITQHLSHTRRQAHILSLLPTTPRIGDKVRRLTRVDITSQDVADGVAVERTLEAMAEGTRLIVNAHLAEGALATRVDVLVREDKDPGVPEDMTYVPVIFSGHVVAKRSSGASGKTCRVLDIGALGLGTPLEIPWKRKNHAADSQTVGIAHVVLRQWGFASDEIGMVSALRTGEYRCFFFSAESVLQGLYAALSEPVPTQPHRVKECATCPFHVQCRAQLVKRLDVSLLLPGGKSKPLIEEGITTLPELAAAERGEQSLQAQAWLNGQPVLRRPLSRWITSPELWGGEKFDMNLISQDFSGRLDNVVEIDVDMEAHPEQGTFLWGTFDGQQYVPFGEWEPDRHGRLEKARHVAEFWAWLKARQAAAARDGQRFQVWVYAAQGENYWLRFYASAFGGEKFGRGPEEVTMPTLDEVNAFIASEHWCDVFDVVNKALVGVGSLGLKTIAPLAGFHFSQEGVDGKAAVMLYERARSTASLDAEAARRTLEKYNADDCYATRAVRHWLRCGAPGIPHSGEQ